MYIFRCIKHTLFKIFGLRDELAQDHELIILERKIDWLSLERELSSFFIHDRGAPALSIRLMASLLILKYMYNLSDQRVLKEWQGNLYYQAFSGYYAYQKEIPCDRSMMSKFRKRIGEKGCNIILKQSIEIYGKKAISDLSKIGIIDSTVQEKGAFPTDIKLASDVIHKIWSIGRKFKIHFRNKYKNNVRSMIKNANFDKSNKKIENKAIILVKLRSIGLTLLEELKKKLPPLISNIDTFEEIYRIYYKVLTQQKTDKDKIYNIYEPQIKCIAKGKTHAKYEFGTKVVLVTGLKNHLIYSIQSLPDNTHDSKTISGALECIQKMYNIKPKKLAGDKGFRGNKVVDDTEIILPLNNMDNMEKTERINLIKIFNRRSDIEEIISHLKNDFRLNKNLLKGIIGDLINPILSAAASNFMHYARKIMSKILNKSSTSTNRGIRPCMRGVPNFKARKKHLLNFNTGI
jgi:IS5 family transposase